MGGLDLQNSWDLIPLRREGVSGQSPLQCTLVQGLALTCRMY